MRGSEHTAEVWFSSAVGYDNVRLGRLYLVKLGLGVGLVVEVVWCFPLVGMRRPLKEESRLLVAEPTLGNALSLFGTSLYLQGTSFTTVSLELV